MNRIQDFRGFRSEWNLKASRASWSPWSSYSPTVATRSTARLVRTILAHWAADWSSAWSYVARWDYGQSGQIMPE